MQLDLSAITKILKMALAEDIGSGDVTSHLLIDGKARARLKAVARNEMVVCGLNVAAEIFRLHDESIKCQILAKEGDWVGAGRELLAVEGNAQKILEAERTVLNTLQRMCGVATTSRLSVELVAGSGVTLLDTRKTMPGMRLLDKYATSVGGVTNHRMRLDDMILIKDNHIAVVGSVAEAVRRARGGNKSELIIVVECDSLEQVEQAIAAGADRIMLDNMTPDEIKQAVALSGGKIKLEASGGINMKNLAEYAITGVDYISLGFLTHSVKAADIGLDIAIE